MIKRPVGTVKARISRGRAILRKQLEKAAGDGTSLRAQEILNGRT
jgi:DNA-directed RNA polymerase specialized sigma24 family protein